MNIAKTKNETEYNYNLEKQNIEWTQEEKDIGVTIDSGLKFGKHISEKVNKANSMFPNDSSHYGTVTPEVTKHLK